MIPLNKHNTRGPKKLPVGNPIATQASPCTRTARRSNGRGGLRQKFCCPFRQSKSGCCPCAHKNWNNGRKNRGCTKSKTIPADYRLSIDRDYSRFKRTYALRSECERCNSRSKASGQERLWVRNGKGAANLNTLAHIAALAVALAAVQYSPRHSYRSVKSLRRTA